MNNIEYNQDVTKDAEGQSRLNDGLGDAVTFDSFFDEMQRLEDERDPIGAQDRRDAKRYRWLKEHGYANEKNASNAVIGDSKKARVAFRYWCFPIDLDALIDGAMFKSPNAELRGRPLADGPA